MYNTFHHFYNTASELELNLERCAADPFEFNLISQ